MHGNGESQTHRRLKTKRCTEIVPSQMSCGAYVYIYIYIVIISETIDGIIMQSVGIIHKQLA